MHKVSTDFLKIITSELENGLHRATVFSRRGPHSGRCPRRYNFFCINANKIGYFSCSFFDLFIEVRKSFALLKHIYGFLLLNLFDSNLDCPDSVGKMFGNNLKN